MKWIVLIVILILGYILWKRTERPKYKLVERVGVIEIREYSALTLAKTEVEGKRREAIREGFKRIAAYIFGDNQSNLKIRMTAPVLQERHENGKWSVYFVMPKKYRLETLPSPNDVRLKIVSTPSRKVAAIRFSGTPSEDILEAQMSILLNFFKEKGLKSEGHPFFAFYNPPWTLPCFRRNEIWLNLSP